MYLDTLGVREMFNMNIKPRLAHIESGAMVECKVTRDMGFVVLNDECAYQVVVIQDNGSMFIRKQQYLPTEHNEFFSRYKMIAQRHEYEGRIEQVTTQH